MTTGAFMGCNPFGATVDVDATCVLPHPNVFAGILSRD
jgi:hypothetical protein